ncbi:MAG: hypothetical protein ACTHJ6_09515 [Oryzihumus sp.]
MTATQTQPIEMDAAFLAEDKQRFGARDFDPGTLMRQIGRGNFLAISGGRMFYNDHGVILPVSNGYKVTVDLANDDTYTVRRIRIQGVRAYLHGEVSGVYCEEVGEVAYRASCFHDGPFGE